MCAQMNVPFNPMSASACEYGTKPHGTCSNCAVLDLADIAITPNQNLLLAKKLEVCERECGCACLGEGGMNS